MAEYTRFELTHCGDLRQSSVSMCSRAVAWNGCPEFNNAAETTLSRLLQVRDIAASGGKRLASGVETRPRWNCSCLLSWWRSQRLVCLPTVGSVRPLLLISRPVNQAICGSTIPPQLVALCRSSNKHSPMSASGTKRTNSIARVMSAFDPMQTFVVQASALKCLPTKAVGCR